MGVTIKSKAAPLTLEVEASDVSVLKSQSWQRQTFLSITKNWAKGCGIQIVKHSLRTTMKKSLSWIKNTKAKCLTSLIFCMKAIVMLRWMQTIAGQFMKSLKTTMTISYMAMPAEKTVQNSLISKKS